MKNLKILRYAQDDKTDLSASLKMTPCESIRDLGELFFEFFSDPFV